MWCASVWCFFVKQIPSLSLFLPPKERALDYLTTCIDQVNEFNDILQLVIVELVYKVRGHYSGGQ